MEVLIPRKSGVADARRWLLVGSTARPSQPRLADPPERPQCFTVGLGSSEHIRATS